MRLRPTRLRTRITLVATGVTLVLMSSAAVAMILVQQRQLFDAVDVSLQESVDEVSRESDVAFDRASRRNKDRSELPAFVASSGRPLQLLTNEGTVLVASAQLRGEPPLVDPAEVLDDPTEAAGEFATVDGDGHDSRYRVAATEVDGDRVLVAAYALSDVDESLEAQRRILVVVIPVLSGVVGLLIWLVLGRALSPVEAMRQEVATIGARELDRRVPVPERSVELASLATTMNDMLQRLDDAATRQRRFVADAAHELRSPITGIRGQLDVNIHHPDAPGRNASEREMLGEAIRMQELVDDLLVLARADDGRTETERQLVDIDDIVFDEAARLRRTVGDLTIDVEAVSAAQVLGDSGHLLRVVRNLADNARRHARSTISFELREHADTVFLAVSDDGPGIPPGQEEAIFDRFARLDESRARGDGGSGLGLAISRELVEQHGGSIRVDGDHAAGARFVVHLPRPTH